MRSNAWVYGRSLIGTEGSNPTEGMDVLSVVSVVCCQVQVSVTGWSLVQRGPTNCGVSECDHGTSQRRPRPSGGLFNYDTQYLSIVIFILFHLNMFPLLRVLVINIKEYVGVENLIIRHNIIFTSHRVLLVWWSWFELWDEQKVSASLL